MDKNCLPWAKEYFATNVKGISVNEDGTELKVVAIDLVTGDCDVTQRKGKVLCIYDMVISMLVSGTVDGTEVSGKILLPEFVHDQAHDDYNFKVTGDDIEAITSKLLPWVLEQMQKFQADLIAAHEQDVQHATGA